MDQIHWFSNVGEVSMIKKLNEGAKEDKKPPYKKVKKVIAVGITILVLAVVLIANAKKNLLF